MSSAERIGHRSASVFVCAICFAGYLQAGSAQAQTVEPTAAVVATGEPPDADSTYLGKVWRRSTLLGDIGGLRPALARHGVSIGLEDTGDTLGNVTGGVRKGWVYTGVTQLSVGVDTKAAFGLEGGIFNVSGLQFHGGNLGTQNLLSLQTPSGIAQAPATRLWELWYQQSFFDGMVDVKIGQQGADQEFIVSNVSLLFLNTALGWPLVPTSNLYAGGPVYPLSSLGLRFRARPTGSLTLLAGVYQDNPPGGPFNDNSQLRGSTRWGANFNLRTGAIFLTEAQYTINQPANGDMDDGSHPAGLPGVYKLGAWFDTAPFNNQRYDTTGLSLADPNSTGVPGQVRQNFSLYGVIDQAIWRPDPDGLRTLNLFARVMGAPGNRNLIEFSFDAGLALKAPLPGRDNDNFGIAYGYGRVSGGAVGLDKDIAYYSGAPYPKRSSESFIEVTYQIQINPWLQLQPDFQYVFLPGGGIPNPNFPNQRISNEAVFGVRTNIIF